MTWGYVLFIITTVVTIGGTIWVFNREDKRRSYEFYTESYKDESTDRKGNIPRRW
jgi:hypothetical protein